jgi:anaerobic selenocysteine-containing dehydrogenase
VADLRATRWTDIERHSGLSREDIEHAAHVYMKAERAIIVYGMGITQHRHGAQNVQQLANLAMLRGHIGREGAGICPVRGHSNVQGDRTVGITEVPSGEFLDRLERRFGFKPPRDHGHNVVTALEAMICGEVKVFVAMGGNFAVAMPDWQATQAALRNLELTVHVSTKLNRSHLILRDRSPSRSRIRCRWFTRRQVATSRLPNICSASRRSSQVWRGRRWVSGP